MLRPVPPYFYIAPGNYRIWEEREPHTQQVESIKIYGQISEGTPHHLDGRPAAPSEYAPHTWMGFSTGKWEGNSLTFTTTHIKRGWLRRNGLRAKATRPC